MGKIVVTMFMTLDGVMEAPQEWSFQFASPEQNQFKVGEMIAADALLLGRVTYEGFAAAWPGRTDEAGFADRMNGVPKYVVSTTLKQADWNNSHIVGPDLAHEVARIKALHQGDILVAGSAQLVRALLRAGLVDEYRLMIFPIVRGKGKRLFDEGLDTTSFTLASSAIFSSGTAVLTYRPAEAPKA
ncbi:MAG TPA: dihydrofolate reductase family protein [Ktedonobacterales bacterium]